MPVRQHNSYLGKALWSIVRRGDPYTLRKRQHGVFGFRSITEYNEDNAASDRYCIAPSLPSIVRPRAEGICDLTYDLDFDYKRAWNDQVSFPASDLRPLGHFDPA